MLKNIPKLLSPKLVKVLMEMGHGDEIVIADGNYPGASNANILVNADGLNTPELLDAILELFPLDTYVESPVTLMSVVEGDEDNMPTIWEDYKELFNKHEDNEINISHISRDDFYEKSRKAYAIITTSEEALYANLILKKGVVK